MTAAKEFAVDGGLVFGIGNGFQGVFPNSVFASSAAPAASRIRTPKPKPGIHFVRCLAYSWMSPETPE